MTAPNFVTERRIGRFSISREMIKSLPHQCLLALEGCVVISAGHSEYEDSVNFVAASADFNKVPEGCVAPQYLCIFETKENPDGTVTITRKWEQET
jgi:hypothetical protein